MAPRFTRGTATEINLNVVSPSGVPSSFGGLPLTGQQQVIASERGTYSMSLVAAIDLQVERREATQQVDVAVA